MANISDLLIGRFPSQNPIVQKREAEFVLVYDEESQKRVADAYMEWWQKNQDKQFQAFKDIDPLLNTGLRWHWDAECISKGSTGKYIR